jgi:hypothetical protein
MPKLINDFTHLLQHDDRLPQTRAVFIRFQVRPPLQRLYAANKRIDQSGVQCL